MLFLVFSSVPACYEWGLEARGVSGLFSNPSEQSINVHSLKSPQVRVSQLGVTVPTIPGKWHTVENTVHIVAIGINQRAFLETRFQELIKIYGIYASKSEESSQKQRRCDICRQGQLREEFAV